MLSQNRIKIRGRKDLKAILLTPQMTCEHTRRGAMSGRSAGCVSEIDTILLLAIFISICDVIDIISSSLLENFIKRL